MKSGRFMDLNQSPGGYPSPYDRKVGRRERAAQFGLCDEIEESFECNQSFPRALNTHHQNDLPHDITIMKGYELNSVSFFKTNFAKNNKNLKNYRLNCLLNDSSMCNNVTNMSCLSNTFDKSWAFYNQFANTNALLNPQQSNESIVALTNPNKALITINGRTSEILTANNITCDLFGYSESELIGMKLNDLLDLTDYSTSSVSTSGAQSTKQPLELLVESDKLDENGRVVLCPGKIFDAITVDQTKNFLNGQKNNQMECKSNQADDEDSNDKPSSSQEMNNKVIIPVSMYMLKLTDEKEPKCLCVIEPVQRILGKFSINLKGKIKTYNSNFSYIFGYTNSQLNENQVPNTPSTLSKMSALSVLKSKEISSLIPGMKIPLSTITPELRKQTLTGRTCNNETIPITVTILNKQLFNNEEIVYNCNVSIYTNITGLVTVRPNDFKINSYNATFARLLFGHDDKELLDKSIVSLIPNFFDPDLNTTAFSSQKQTPFNNSYLNAENIHGGTNKKINSMHGSFIENHRASLTGPSLSSSSSKRVSINLTPTKLQLDWQNAGVEPKSKPSYGKMPSLVVVDVDKEAKQNEMETDSQDGAKNCTMCGCRFKSVELDNDLVKNKENDLMVNFDLKELDYSPNQKCAQYIQNNSFNANNASTPNTPEHHLIQQLHSAKKGSLLVKAIANNKTANERANLSIDELSITSSSSNSSSISTSSPNKNGKSFSSSLSHVNVSEFDYDRDECKSNQLCNNCKPNNKCNDDNEEKAPENNPNEVSLINTTTDECDEEGEYGDYLTCGGKRKDIDLGDDNGRRVSFEGSTNPADNKMPGSNENIKKFKNQVTSTPAANSLMKDPAKLAMNINTNLILPKLNKQSLSPTESASMDGLFFGRARHNDGSMIKIFYQRRLVKVNNSSSDNGNNQDKYLICVWISRDPYTDKSMIECSMDQSQMFKSNNKLLNYTTCNENSNYLNEYEDLRTLGRGVSGFVQLARRKLDNFEVVTKYIFKSKIYKENWIDDARYGNIPLEISLLCKLDHPNIIKVLEVFQDAEHVQMVMEKHGSGMDLFEFIDRQRKQIDERLASYIFKQIISAVSYLHANSIVHRDIKDENIVINENFEIKLIDFGSAAYITKGKKFATFCGTMDYCSPEVLLGNKYHGPELDIWTCGVALYTLIFSENPFFDAEETIECILKPPFKVSKELMKLLFSILTPKPEIRATMSEIESNSWVNQEVDISMFKWEDVIKNTDFQSNDAGDCRGDDLVASAKKPLAQLDINKENVAGESNDDATGENNINENKKNNNQQKFNFFSTINAFLSKSF